jgi:NADH-quinone oxidoreductase subunit M
VNEVTEILWAAQAGYPPLATLQWLPLAAAVLLMIMREDDLALVLGRLFAVAELVVAIDLYARIDVTRNVLQFAERLDVFAYHAAADGVSVLFILLTALLGVLLSFYGMARQQTHAGATAQRPAAHRIVADGHADDHEPAVVCRCFGAATGARSLTCSGAGPRRERRTSPCRAFCSISSSAGACSSPDAVVLVWSHADVLGGHWSFDLFDLLQTPQIGKYQSVAFYLLFYGLAIRTPLFPLHGWLPNSAGYGLIAVGPVLLLGVKVGIYGMARFLLPLTAEAVMIWQPYVVAFAMVGVFFAAVMAFRQANLRRLMAFAVVSHTSLIVIGLFTLHPGRPAGRAAAGGQLRPGDHADAVDGRLRLPPHRYHQSRPARRPVRPRALHRRRLS